MSNTKEVGKNIPPSNKTYEDKIRIVNNLRAYTVTKDPSLHGILTFIQHEVVSEKHPLFNTVAFTNGDKVFFGDLFFSVERPFQCGILLHEMFHIVFRHITRGKKRFARLWNIATDCVINESIGFKKNRPAYRPNVPWYIDDEFCVSLESTLESLNASNEIKNKSISEWTSEKVYELLLKELKKNLEKEVKDKGKDDESSDGASGPSSRRDTPLGEIEKEIDKLLEKLAEKHKGMPGNDIEEGESKDERTSEIGDAIWTERFNRAKSMGMGTHSILGKINPDIYKPQIPWNKELRKYLNVRCMPQLTSTMSRPGRRMLSMPKARTYLPGLEKIKGLDKMMVIIDTSGSCFNQEELTMFCSEIDAIQRNTGVEIALIFADTEIKAEYIVKNDGVSFLDKVKKGKVEAKGGGGTDMVVPFIEGKKKYNPNLVCICSDGFTPFPSKAQVGRTNVLWVINTEATIPKTAGKCLRIKPI